MDNYGEIVREKEAEKKRRPHASRLTRELMGLTVQSKFLKPNNKVVTTKVMQPAVMMPDTYVGEQMSMSQRVPVPPAKRVSSIEFETVSMPEEVATPVSSASKSLRHRLMKKIH